MKFEDRFHQAHEMQNRKGDNLENSSNKSAKYSVGEISESHPIFKKVKNGNNPIYEKSKIYFHDPSQKIDPMPEDRMDPFWTSIEEDEASAKWRYEQVLKNQSYRRPKDSFRLVTWVITHSSLAGSSKLIAARIASHFNTGTKLICPSIETICAETGYNSATVQKAIKAMVESKEWEVKRRYASESEFSHNFYTPLAPHENSWFHGWSWIANKDLYEEKKLATDGSSAKRQANLTNRLEMANELLELKKKQGMETSLSSIKSLAQINQLHSEVLNFDHESRLSVQEHESWQA